MTPTDKRPRELFIGYPDGETPEVVFDVSYENTKGAVKFIEHSAYLAVKQELEKCEALLRKCEKSLHSIECRGLKNSIYEYFAEFEK